MNKSRLFAVLFALTLTGVSVWAEGNLEPPVPVRTVAPEYPVALKRDGTTGVVTLSVLIDEKGAVQEPKVVKASNDAFAQPALEAITKWKFKPAQRDGNAVPIRVNIPIKFTVED